MIVSNDKCYICGQGHEFTIEDDATLLREAKCTCCGTSIRNSDVAAEILKYIDNGCNSLRDISPKQINKYEILNTCSSGSIHDALKQFDTYMCSEYFDDIPSGEYYKGILCVDLTHIPFKDNSLNLIISEDVFEHVECVEEAFREIYRVLRPGGCHIFTVPIHDGRKTTSRVGKRDVYHGDPNPLSGSEGVLVYTDWGDDITEILAQYGYECRMERSHIFYSPEEVTDVDSTYDEYLNKRSCLEKYQKYNSIVIIAIKPYQNHCNEDIYHYSEAELLTRRFNKIILLKNEEIHQLNDDNEARGRHIQKLDFELEEKGVYIRKFQSEVENHHAQIVQKDMQIHEQQQTIRNQEGHIEQLLEAESRYQRELNSKTYKLAKKMQKAFSTILPPNSRRRFFCRVLWNMIRHPRLMMHVLSSKRIKHYFKYMKEEGMSGVIRRYNEAEELERERLYPNQGNGIYLEQVEEKTNIEDYDPLVLPDAQSDIAVSIVIPVYNEFHYTYNCIKSIITNSGDIPYEVIIANDCSTDITSEIEQIVENVRLISTEQNSRFLLNCNNAARCAKGKYILFLNNDTQVQKNWLAPLIELIERDDSIGMVGSKLVYPDGLLQEAGGIVWKDASAWNYGHRADPKDSEYNYVKEVDYISGAAIMIKADLWRKIGGFDERFVPAYYEDTDLAFEVRKCGYKVMYQPLSVVVHYEGISNGTDVSTGLKHYQQVNFEKFYDKWKDVLDAEHENNGENVFTAKDRSKHKKHILVIDHYVPHYDQDAGSKCTYMYLQLFEKMGFQVTFIGDNFYKHEPYTTELNQKGIEVLYGEYYHDHWQEWLKNNAHYFDYVHLQRPHVAVKYIDLIKQFSKAKIFYYACDLHYLREYREYELTHDKKLLESSNHWKAIEHNLFQKADIGHVVSSYEQNILEKEFPDKPIRTIPIFVYKKLLEDINKDFESRTDIIFVGGFGHKPNVDAVIWFANEIYPLILKKYPDMKWHIVGGKATDKILELASDNIIIEGFLSDEDLDRLYRKCRLAVVPLRYGAGVKGKVVEAGYYQIPLITTTIGAEGISTKEGSMIVEDDAGKMAKIICDLYEDYDHLKEMSDNGKIFIKNNYMIDKAERVIKLDMEV